MLLFSNNAEAVLATALAADSNDTEFSVSDAGMADEFASPTNGQAQLATLTNDSLPGAWEVVRIVSRSNTDFVVVREHELAAGAGSIYEWPIGTKISARVTAATLRSFVQYDAAKAPVHRASSASVGEKFVLSHYPVLRDRRMSAGGGTPSSFHDPAFAVEVVGGSVPVDLGATETWTSGTPYNPMSVVVPDTPDGFQYWLDLNDDTQATGSQTDVAPTFAGSMGGTEARDGNSPADQVVGYWTYTELPIDIIVDMGVGNGLVLTEVGFIARAVTAAANPFVSIGIEADATEFVNNQQLTQITGSGQVHRFHITAGGPLVEKLRFKVDTAASGGTFRGRFYWRGFFLNSQNE